MALPQYHEVLADPEYRNATPDRQKEINDTYWNLYDKENPGDMWAKDQREHSTKVLDARKSAQDASPIMRRALDLQIDASGSRVMLNNMVRAGAPQEEIDKFSTEAQARVKQGQERLKKTFSLFDPKVDEQMQPAWKALEQTAKGSGYFEGTQALRGPDGELLYGDRTDEQRGKYEGYRNQLATDFNLQPEEVDDLVKHRIGAQKDLISRDALGVFHVKDELLAKGLGDLQRGIVDSNLPMAAKNQLAIEAPAKISAFKERTLLSVKQNHKELAADIKWTGDVNKDYAALTEKLNQGRMEQLGSGALSALSGRGEIAAGGPQISPTSGFGGMTVLPGDPEASRAAQEMTKRLESINQLSDYINQEKVRILGVDAATIGQGLYSGAESIVLGAMLPAIGTAAISADRINKAGKFGQAVLKATQRGLNTAPIATIYGADQALQTYEESKDIGKALLSGAIASGVTTFFGAVNLGGVEDVGQKLMNRGVREGLAKSVRKSWAQFALGTGIGTASEIPEELMITALDNLYVQSQLHPGMTREQLKKNLYDTLIATVAAAGPATALGSAAEQGTNLFKPTYESTTDELERTADDIAKTAAQENLPPDQAAGGAVTPSGDAGVAPRKRPQMTRAEVLEAAEARKASATDEERQILEGATPEEIAARYGVELVEDESLDTVTETAPAAPPTPAPFSEEGIQQRTIQELYEKELEYKDAIRNSVTDPEAQDVAKVAQEGLNRVRAEIKRRKEDPNFVEPSPAPAETVPTESLPADETAAPPAGGVATPVSQQPSENLPARATESVEPRPTKRGDERDTWDEKYGGMVKGGRTHNDDGTPYQPTLFDETTQRINRDLKGKTDEEVLDAVGVLGLGIEQGTAVRQLLDDGWVWDTDRKKMVNPNNPSETPKQGLDRIRKPITPQPNENQIPETGGAPAIESQPAQPSPEVQVEEGAASGQGQGPQDLVQAPLEEIAKAAIENPNDVNAALLVLAAAGIRPESVEVESEPEADANGQLRLFQLPETHTPIPEAEIPTRQEPASDLSYGKLKENVTAFKKMVFRLLSHHVFRVGDITDLSTGEVADRVLKQMVNNILFVYDSVPEVIRTESKKWYKGANRIANMWSKKYGVSTQAVAGVIAALSPQKDWFQNVSLAERVLDIWTGNNRVTNVFGPEMADAAAKMDTAQASEAKGKKYIEVEGVRTELFEHAQRLKDLMGRDFDSLGILDKAFFIRLYDETYNSRSYSLITPDGRFGKEHINKDGSPTKIAWGTVHMTASAVAMLENPSVDNISKQLGHAHKIRSFYNNIINPDSDQTVTSDTHAVAVAYMMPLSGASREVTDNFGGISTDGYRGTYAFIAEAYRRAAKKRGVKPSEMQSVTWEAIRDIFPATFKRNKGKVDQIRELWDNFSRNRTKESYEKVRQRAYEAGGGYAFPQWYQQPELGFGDSGTSWDRTTTYVGKDRGGQPDGLPAGTGRGDGRSRKGTGPKPETGRAAGEEQRTLFQVGEAGGRLNQEQEPYTGPKATYDLYNEKAGAAGQAVIRFIQGVSDPSSGSHESFHAIYDFLRAVGENDKADALDKWAEENVGDKWEAQQEYMARGFERFLINGVKTGIEAVDRAFARIAEIMYNIYKGVNGLKGSSVDINIPPHIEKIFNDLMSRGYQLETQGQKPDVVPLKVKKEAKPKPATKPAAKPATKPTTKPKKELPPLPPGPSKSTSLKNAATDRYLEENGMAPIMRPAKEENEETWNEAMALVEDDPGFGSRLVEGVLSSKRNVGNQVEEAVMLHELAIRKAAVARARNEVNKGNQDARRDLEAAQKALVDVITAAKMVGTTTARMLQFRKRFITEDFSLEAMEAQFQAEINDGEKISEVQAAWIKSMQKKVADAQARTAELEAQIAAQEKSNLEKGHLDKVEKDVAKTKKKPVDRRTLTERVVERVSSARDRLRSRGFGVTRLEQAEEQNIPDDAPYEVYNSKTGEVVWSGTYGKRDVARRVRDRRDTAYGANVFKTRLTKGRTLYQEPELTSQDIEDLSEILAGYIVMGDSNDVALEKLSEEFGAMVDLNTDTLLEAAQTFISRMAAGSRAKTPQELVNLLDADNPELSNRLVYNMVRGLIEQGIPKEKVLKKVHQMLLEKMPDVTFDQVSDAFTGYGKVKFPDPAETAKAVRELRNIERIKRQIREIEAGNIPKKTGQQRDAATARIRELQKELKEAFRAAGIKHTTSAIQLKGALDAIKTRLRNELEDLQRAIDTKTRIARKKTTIEYDQDILDLQKARDAKRQEYDKIFGVNRRALTDAQRLRAAVRMLNKRIKEEKDLAYVGLVNRIKAKSTPVTSAEVEALRKNLNDLVEIRRKAKAALHPPLSEEARIISRAKGVAERQIAYYEKLKAGIKPTKKDPINIVPEEELARLWELRDELKAAVAEMRREQRRAEAKSPEERARAASIRALERSVKDLESRLARGDLSKRTRTPLFGPHTAAVAELQKRQEAARAALKALRDAKLPSKEERREQALIRASVTRRKKWEARIAAGDFVKVEPVTRTMSRELAEARLAEAKAKEEWNRRFFEKKLAERTGAQITWDTTTELVNFSRSVMTSADVSAPFRQGMISMLMHPVLSFRAIPQMFFSGFSQVRHKEFLDKLERHPLYAIATQAGLFMPDADQGATMAKMEEAFRGRWAREFTLTRGVVGFSERAYNAYLSQVRLQHFASMVNGFANGKPTDKEAKIVADFVNKCTGRGNLADAESSAAVLAHAFFSPKFLVSRFQVLLGSIPAAYGAALGPQDLKRARRAILGEYARFLVGASSVYALGVLVNKMLGGDDEDEPFIQIDPRSSKFGQMRFGKTYIDLMGGLLQAATLMSRILPTKNAEGVWSFYTMTRKGELKDLRMAGYGEQSVSSVIGQFIRGKMAPVPSSLLTMMNGVDVIGRPTTIRAELIGTLMPLSFGDITNIIQEHGVGGVPLALAVLFGVGVRVHNEEMELEQYLSTWIGVDKQVYEKKNSADKKVIQKIKF